jgi:hypothetical protein
MSNFDRTDGLPSAQSANLNLNLNLNDNQGQNRDQDQTQNLPQAGSNNQQTKADTSNTNPTNDTNDTNTASSNNNNGNADAAPVGSSAQNTNPADTTMGGTNIDDDIFGDMLNDIGGTGDSADMDNLDAFDDWFNS